MFIALEGADLSGKTEQAERLVARLRGTTGRDVMPLAFPSESPAGIEARKMLATDNSPHDRSFATRLQLIFAGDRYSYIGQIQNHLRRGGIVVVDRWTASGEVYGVGDGLDLDWITALQVSLPKPDLNILLDVDIQIVTERLCSRPGKLECFENRDFQRGVIARYRNLWKMMSLQDPAYWVSINAAASPEIVHSEIFRHVQSALKGRSFD